MLATWQRSHHAQAIQVATDATVLATFEGEIGDARLSRDSQGQFVANLPDATGTRSDYHVTHTFGVAPLQQYLVDTGGGRLQTLRQSWDARSAHAAGQRWFEQYAGQHIPPGDVLHWDGIAQNWNSMCADCHSTAVQKGYDAASATFTTTFEELSVGCEACHGPGQAHADNPAMPLPGTAAMTGTGQADVCAQCHARRAQIAEGFTAGQELLDFYVPELLNPPLYHADGQILDEVYVYGSFTASKMHQRGVVCSDCHNPHSAELRAPPSQVCQQCHSPAGNPRFATLRKADYTSPDHHMHPAGSAGAQCVACHMPSRVYMGIDERHDHSFRIPRPDLEGTPNACASCHADVPHATLAAQIRDHVGRAPQPGYADLFVQPPTRPSTEQALVQLGLDTTSNPQLRATALSRLTNASSAGARRAFEQASQAPSPLVRLTSLQGMHLLSPARARGTLQRLLTDPVRAVRQEAAQTTMSLLDEAARRGLPLAKPLAEYRATQALHLERPEAHVNLANLALRSGAPDDAQTHLRAALAVNPQFVPALLNLADLHRARGDDVRGATYLKQAIAVQPTVPQALQAWGLWLVRNGEREASLEQFAAAHRLAPQDPDLTYIYAVALNSLGQADQALQVLNDATDTAAYTARVAELHASIYRDQNRLRQP